MSRRRPDPEPWRCYRCLAPFKTLKETTNHEETCAVPTRPLVPRALVFTQRDDARDLVRRLLNRYHHGHAEPGVTNDAIEALKSWEKDRP